MLKLARWSTTHRKYVLLGWIVLSETPPALALAGGVLCLFGVALTRRP